MPYVAPLHPLVASVLAGHELTCSELSEGMVEGYPDLLAEWWRGGEAFAVVEHDVLPWPGALEELEACPEPWCGFAYVPGVHRRVPTLGCVRFAAEFLERLPGALEPARWSLRQFPRDWRYCDQQIALQAGTVGLSWHQHFPAVTHAHSFRDPW